MNTLNGDPTTAKHLGRMAPGRFALVREAVEVYKGLRAELPGAVPVRPLRLPGRDDGWLALGLRTAHGAGCPTVWHRADEPVRALPPPVWRGRALEPEVRYPAAAPGSAEWSARDGTLTVTLPRTPTALLLRPSPR